MPVIDNQAQTIKLLAQQRELLIQAQREARLRGETREARPGHEPLRRFMPRYDEQVRTFEQFAWGENRKVRPYSWITR